MTLDPRADHTVIRRPREADAELFARLEKVTFPWASQPDQATWAARHFRGIADPASPVRAPFVIADVDGQFAGYASASPFAPYIDGGEVISPDTPVAVVPQVAVVPKHRGRGVGTRLVEALQGELARADYSVAIAHIRTDLAAWYKRMGWIVLPERAGFAWMEPPSVLNKRMLPSDAPAEVVAEHTPSTFQVPMGTNGYTMIAVRPTGGPVRTIVAGYFDATDDLSTNARLAAQTLIQALDADPAALRRIPHASAMLLHMSSLTHKERISFAQQRFGAAHDPQSEGAE